MPNVWDKKESICVPMFGGRRAFWLCVVWIVSLLYYYAYLCVFVGPVAIFYWWNSQPQSPKDVVHPERDHLMSRYWSSFYVSTWFHWDCNSSIPLVHRPHRLSICCPLHWNEMLHRKNLRIFIGQIPMLYSLLVVSFSARWGSQQIYMKIN